MRNYFRILVMLLVSLNINSQTLDEGMILFTNTYIIKYIEPYTDVVNYDVWEPAEEVHSKYLKDPSNENSSITFKESVDEIVLNNLKKLIKENPQNLSPYFDSDTHKFSAFVLFLYTYGIRAEGCKISSFLGLLPVIYPDGELSINTKEGYPLLSENEILLKLWNFQETSVEAKQMFTDFLSDTTDNEGW